MQGGHNDLRIVGVSSAAVCSSAAVFQYDIEYSGLASQGPDHSLELFESLAIMSGYCDVLYFAAGAVHCHAPFYVVVHGQLEDYNDSASLASCIEGPQLGC